MRKMIKDFFINVITIVVFLAVWALILSQCTPKENNHPRQIHQPTKPVEQEEEKDMLQDAKRNAEFWTIMIPAL